MASSKKPIALPLSNKRRNLFYAAFIVINLFLSCYYLDIWITPNATSRALPVLSLYENHSLAIDNYKDYSSDKSKVKDHYYSDKAPLSSFVVFPFYALHKSLKIRELKDRIPYAPAEVVSGLKNAGQKKDPVSTALLYGDIVCGAIPFVIILVLSLFAIKKPEPVTAGKGDAKVSPVVVVMLSFYASYLFVYAGTFTGHMLSGVLVLTGYIFIKRKNYVLSGLMLGIAMATEFTVGLLVPVWAVLIYMNEKKVSKSALFAAGLIPGVLIIALYNLHFTGSPFVTTYSYLANKYAEPKHVRFPYHPRISAIWGLIFSPYRGALFYAPVLIVLLWYVIRRNAQQLKGFLSGKGRELINAGVKNYFLVTIVMYLLVISSLLMWAGGYAFGPRHIIPIIIICLYEGASFLISKKFSPWFFYILSTIGLLFTWMDKSTKLYLIPDDTALFGNPVFDTIIPDFFKHRFNANTLPVFLFDSSSEIAVYAWPVLFTASLLILTRWHCKLYPAYKNTMNIYFPLAFLPVIIAGILIPPDKEDKHNTLASVYLSAAQSSEDPVKKTQYYSHAASEFEQVMQLDSADPAGYYKLGVCYSGEGYKDSAILAYKKALKLNPKYSEASNNIGSIYLNKAQYDTAISYFIMSYNANPNNLIGLENIGVCYQRERKYALAFYYDSLVLKRTPAIN
jgi:hypothetical protein